eukprot:1003386_1
MTSLNSSVNKHNNTKQSRSPPINLTTNALTNFASNLQQDIVQQVLKELKLKEKDGDSKLFVVMCKFMDEIVHNINESLVNKIENIKQQNTKYLNSFDIMIKQQQQQQQQLQQNINNKFDALTNIMYTNLKDIQIKLKQSAQRQCNISASVMNKKNKNEQQLLSIKQIENKVNVMTNTCLNNIQYQKKIHESSLEKMDKKLHEQTNKLIYNNNLGINKLLKQTKIIKNKFKKQISSNNSPNKSDDIIGKHLQSQSQPITNKLHLNDDNTIHGSSHTLRTTSYNNVTNGKHSQIQLQSITKSVNNTPINITNEPILKQSHLSSNDTIHGSIQPQYNSDLPIHQSQSITNKLQLNGDSITHGTIKQSNNPTLPKTATKSIPNTPKHIIIQDNIQSKPKPDSTLQHTTPIDIAATSKQSLPNTPKHKTCSTTLSHSNISTSKTHAHSNYITSKTHSHSDHSTLIGKQCTTECDSHSKSLPSTPTRILKSNSNNHQHYSYSTNNTPISKLKSMDEIKCEVKQYLDNNKEGDLKKIVLTQKLIMKYISNIEKHLKNKLLEISNTLSNGLST